VSLITTQLGSDHHARHSKSRNERELVLRLSEWADVVLEASRLVLDELQTRLWPTPALASELIIASTAILGRPGRERTDHV